MKSSILLVMFVGLCGAQTTVNGGRDYKGTLKASGTVSSVDFSGAGTTAPVKAGLLASRPAACNQGQIYFATDAVAGQNLFFCTTTGSPGTWSQMTGSAASATTTGSGAPGGSCTPPAMYIDAANQDLWFCGTANVWKKATVDTSGFPTLGGANSWTGYNNLSAAQWRPPESTVGNLPAPAGNTGKVFMVTDAAAAGNCSTGGGTVRELCRATGANYECVGGCGMGGTPGGVNGQIQYNNSGAFGGVTAVPVANGGTGLTGGTSGGIPCFTGSTTLASTAAWTANAIMKGGGTGACPMVTGITVDSSNNIATAGSTTTGNGSGVAGAIDLSQGTTPAAQASNTFRIYAPASIGTAFAWKVPSADAAGSIVSDGAGNLSIAGFSGTGSIVKVTSPTFVTPILGAATATSINGTAVSGAGTTVVNGGANIGAAAMTLDMSASTGSSALRVPVKTGVSTSVNGAIGYDATTDMLHAAQGSTDAMIPQFTATPGNGDCANWVASGSKFKLGTAGAPCGSGGSATGASLFSTTNSTAVTATSATTLIGTVQGSTTIPANTLTGGQFMQIIAEGYYSTPATPTNLTIDLKIGGAIRITTGAVTTLASVTNGTWRLSCGVTTRTAGASGTQIANCMFTATGSTAGSATPMQTSSTWTIDTTVTNGIDLLATWSTATGSPTITSTNIAAWIPGAPVTSVFGQTGAINNLSGDVTTSGSPAATIAAKYKTVKVIGYEVGAENGSALATADLTSHAFAINDANSKTVVEANCISDAGDQPVTVKIGSTTLFTIHCVAPGTYNTGTTDGTTGYIIGGSMGSTAVGAHSQLDLSGTANSTTKDVKLHVYGMVN